MLKDGLLGESGARRRPLFHEKYDLVKELGSGAYGGVYLAKDKDSGERVAAKVLKKKSNWTPEVFQKRVMQVCDGGWWRRCACVEVALSCAGSRLGGGRKVGRGGATWEEQEWEGERYEVQILGAERKSGAREVVGGDACNFQCLRLPKLAMILSVENGKLILIPCAAGGVRLANGKA